MDLKHSQAEFLMPRREQYHLVTLFLALKILTYLAALRITEQYRLETIFLGPRRIPNYLAVLRTTGQFLPQVIFLMLVVVG
jgi:hypothetical protein